jgi:hypothetical protein
MLGLVFEESDVDRATTDGRSLSTPFEHSFLASRLDWLWPRIAGPNQRIDGIKIDVQGMEIQVLEGMAAVAKQYRPKLFVELHRGVSRSEFLEVVSSLGYLPRGLAVEPLPGESDPAYADNRTYLFTPDRSRHIVE